MMVGLRSLPTTIEHAQWVGIGVYQATGSTYLTSPQVLPLPAQAGSWKYANTGYRIPGGGVPFRLFEVSVTYFGAWSYLQSQAVASQGAQAGGYCWVELYAGSAPANPAASVTVATIKSFRLLGRYVAGERTAESVAVMPGEYVYALAYCEGIPSTAGFADKPLGLVSVQATFERQA